MSLESNLKAFLKENPNDPMVLLSLGNICLREERFEEAIACLMRAVNADPEYMAAYPVLGECYERLDQSDKAKDAYRTALELAERFGDRTMAGEMREKLTSLEETDEI